MKVSSTLATVAIGLVFVVGCAVEYAPELGAGQPESGLLDHALGHKGGVWIEVLNKDDLPDWCSSLSNHSGSNVCHAITGDPPTIIPGSCESFEVNGIADHQADDCQMQVHHANCEACCLACYGDLAAQICGAHCPL